MSREWVDGRHAVRELLRARRRTIYRVVMAHGAGGEHLATIRGYAEARGIPLEYVKRAEIERLAGGRSPQGVAIEVDPYPYVSFETVLDRCKAGEEPPFLLISAGIQDPQNLGALLRTAEAAGVQGAVLPERRAAGITPAVVRTSAGASEYLAIARVVNLVRAIERLKEDDIWIYAGIPDAEQRYDEANLSGGIAVVVGAEGAGVPRLVAERCDGRLRIPVRGRLASLNAAAAGAVLLFAVRSYRDQAGA